MSRNDQMVRSRGNGLCDHYQQCSNGSAEIERTDSDIFLPPNACCTLIVEGLPANFQQWEINFVFRHLYGYQSAKLWTAESSEPGGGLVTACVAYFDRPEHAAVAMNDLQGRTFDVRNGNAFRFKLQFFCAALRVGGTSRGSS